MSLKQKTINGLSWSFVETLGNQGFQFVVGVILARLLIPEDYGLIGVLAIFLGVAGVLVDSGFKTSIIRSQDLTEVDCSTIFYVNLFISIIIALLLFFCANGIAIYFQNQELVKITRTLALIPVLNGFGLVQSALLFKNLQFKINARISIISNIISGLFAIILAYSGFSYWALVWKAILGAGIYNLLLWINSSWQPQLVFSSKILKKHFRFSSKLLFTGMIDTFFDNIYSFIFGRFYSFKELGFFTRGKGFVDIVTKTLSVTIQKVNTPLLASSGKEDKYKINAYSKLLQATTFVIFPATVLLIVIAKTMIVFLIGEQWLPSVSFLQILAISGMIYPVLNANSSLLEVLGRSDLILRSALISRPIQTIILLITINFSAITIAWGIVFHFTIIFLLSFYFVKKVTNQRILELISILFLPTAISVIMGSIIFLIGILLESHISVFILLIVQILLGGIILFYLFYVFKIIKLETIKNFFLRH